MASVAKSKKLNTYRISNILDPFAGLEVTQSVKHLDEFRHDAEPVFLGVQFPGLEFRV